jgi:histone H3/H4
MPPARMSAPKIPGVKKPLRHAPGTVAARQVRSLQKTGELLIPKESFGRVVRELAEDLGLPNMRWSAGAIAAMQTALEDHTIKISQATELCAKHAGRKGINKEDLQLVNGMIKIFQTDPNPSEAI